MIRGTVCEAVKTTGEIGDDVGSITKNVIGPAGHGKQKGLIKGKTFQVQEVCYGEKAKSIRSEA